jgi:uncharacterized Rmd1/YagE family protein
MKNKLAARPSLSIPVRPSHVDPARRTEKQKPLIFENTFNATAVMVAERVDVKALGELPIVAESPALARLPDGGIAALFRYGAVVLFNATTGDHEWLLAAIQPHCTGQHDELAIEHARVVINHTEDEGPARGNVVTIHSANRDRLQLLAEAMAKSALLSYQEHRAARDFDRIEPLAQDLAEDGRFSVKSKELLKGVGSMLLSEHRLTGRAEVTAKPDLLWDRPHLEGLYARLAGEYELDDRALVLERKLATLSHTSETLVETMRYQVSHRLEFYVVVLILIEVFMSAYSHFRS